METSTFLSGTSYGGGIGAQHLSSSASGIIPIEDEYNTSTNMEATSVHDYEQEYEQEYIERSRSSRLPLWIGMFISSLVTLGSSMEAAEGTFDEKSVSDRKWAVACSSMTFIVTSIVLLLLLHPVYNIFMAGTKLEGVIIIISAVFWSSVVSVSTTPAAGLAIDNRGAISYGNLYYFSWISFACALALIISFIKSFFFIDLTEEMQARGKRLSLWTYLFFFGMLMTGASAAIFDYACSSYADPVIPVSEAYCRRTVFALVLSIGACCASVAVIGMKIATVEYKTKLFLIEAYTGFVMVLAFVFGVAFVTSQKGPGGPIGNLYYTTWASFACLVFIGCSCFEELQEVKASTGIIPTTTTLGVDMSYQPGDPYTGDGMTSLYGGEGMSYAGPGSVADGISYAGDRGFVGDPYANYNVNDNVGGGATSVYSGSNGREFV